MNLSHLTKEQKQYIVLGAFVVAAVAGIVIAVRFSVSSIESAKAELSELNLKNDRAEQALSKTATSMDRFEATILELKERLDHVPPEQNYYSWATEIIYFKGRKAGLEIESVDEVGMRGSNKKAPVDPVYFETYSLRVTARGGFDQTKAFLQDIEENHPLVRFSGLEISRGRTLESHDVQLFVQWPFKMNRIASLWDDQSIRRKTAVVNTDPNPEIDLVQPIPEVVNPAPVVVATKPAAKPEPVKSAPVVNKPTPIVAVVEPVPPPKREPPPPTEPVPAVKKPELVVADVEPVPAPKLEHQKEDDQLLSILASINQEEGNAVSSETEPEVASEQSENEFVARIS